MTAVANPPSFANINRPAWGSGGQSLNNLNSLNNANHHDDVRSMFAPRNKSMQRTNSSSSIASTTSNASSNASSASSAYTVVSSNGSSSSAAVNNGGPVGGGGGSGVSTPASDANGVPIPTLRKRPLQQQKGHWSANSSNINNNNNIHKQPDGQQPDFMRGAAAARQQMSGLHPGGPNGMMVSSLHQLPPFVAGGHQSAAAAAAAASAGNNGLNGVNGVGGPNGLNGFRSSAGNNDAAAAAAAMQQGGQQPVLYLLSLNGTFDRKTITVPFVPDTLRIGRQTNKSTAPSTVNGYFDSKVLSRQHAEIWADRQGKIWIRDIKSSNGTFVNGTRLSAENRESEPHELQTSDHLELGIDIVSEDQKSVVHHKVAAKVEHAGFVSAANNSLLDMSYGDLDPANGALMLGGGGGGGLGGLGGVGGGTSLNGMGGLGGAGGPFRGRTGSQASLGPAGRMAPTSGMGGGAAQANGMALQQQQQQRGLWFTGPSTEAIVKKIHQEMRLAKQQSQDLLRTQEFLRALLSKDDIRNEQPNPSGKADAAAATAAAGAAATGADALKPAVLPPAPPMVNGIVAGGGGGSGSGSSNAVSFRADAKARFSDPPAPPPQQPLPKKPDVPSLKRGSTERAAVAAVAAAANEAATGATQSTSSNTSPVRPDVLGQVLQLTDALNTAKREIDTQHARMCELEETLHREQDARKAAEELARRLEEAAAAAAAMAAAASTQMNGAAKGPGGGDSTLEEAFEPPPAGAAASDAAASTATDTDADTDTDSDTDAAFRTRVDAMLTEMESMKQQLDAYRSRAEQAEAERDADRQTLAEMVKRIRQRDEEDARRAAAAAASTTTSSTTTAPDTTSTSDTTLTTTKTKTTTGAHRSFSRGRRRPSRSRGLLAADTEGGADAAERGGVADGPSLPDGALPAADGAAAAHDPTEEPATLSRANTLTPGGLAASASKAEHGTSASSAAAVAAAQQDRAALVHGIPYASMVGVVLLGMGLMAYLNGWQPQPARLDR